MPTPDTAATPTDAARKLDVDRAALAGGFDGDMETGRQVVLATHAYLRDHRTSTTDERYVKTLIDEVTAEIADLYESDPMSDPMWLSVMHNGITGALRDIVEQIREARAAVTA